VVNILDDIMENSLKTEKKITIEFIRWDGDAHSINSDFSRGIYRMNSEVYMSLIPLTKVNG